MSNPLLPVDITQALDLPPTESVNDRTKQMFEAYRNPAWPNHQTVDQSMAKVSNALLFQIVMVENISKSKLSQLDDIKAKIDPKSQKADRLNTSKNGTRGQQSTGNNRFIAVMDMESDRPADANNSSNSFEKTVFKLTLQDKAGSLFYAINLSPLYFLKNDGSACMLGSKIILLPGAIFNRGVFLLTESTVLFMGGMVKQWNDGRDRKMCQYLEAKLERDKPVSRKRKVTSVEDH